MDIDKTIAKLELKSMLEELLDTDDYPINSALASIQNWTKKNLNSFNSCVKALLPPGSRICFWSLLPIADGGKTRADFFELKDGSAEVKTLHAPHYDENEAENIQSIHFEEFFYMLKREIKYGLFFFPPWSSASVEHGPGSIYDQPPDVSFVLKRKNLEFTGLMMQLLELNK